MTREQHLEYCKKCVHKHLDFERGLICQLTNEIADFEGTCKHFKDEQATEKAKSISQAKQPAAYPMDHEAIIEEIQQHEHLPFAIIGGVLTAMICATIWALISYLLEFQVGIMAILLGIAVGFSVRFYGSGIRPVFGIIGALLALSGCLFGNWLTQIAFAMDDSAQGLLEVMSLFDLQMTIDIFKESFQLIDLLFYGIAMFEGYKFAFRPIPENTFTDSVLAPKYEMMKTTMIATKTCILLAIFGFTSLDIGNHENYHYQSGNVEASGAWKAGVEHGKWVYYHDNGEPYTVMNYYEGKEEGEFNQFYESGQLYATGEFTNGLEDGPWLYYDEMGNLFYSCNYSLGRETGERMILHSDGHFLEHGKMNRDLQVGMWEYKYENGQLEKKGEFKEGVQNGIWTYYFPDGTKSREIDHLNESEEKVIAVHDTSGVSLVENGTGWCTLYDNNLDKYLEGKVENGDKIGEWTWFYSDGSVKAKGKFLKDGFRFTSFWNSKREQTVVDGLGDFADLNIFTGLFEKGKYENGKKTGKWVTYYPESEAIYTEEVYFDGKLRGTLTSFYESGEIESQGRMLDIDRDGRWIHYFASGQKSSEVVYRKGLKSGVEKFWNERGILVKEEEYLDNELQSEKLY